MFKYVCLFVLLAVANAGIVKITDCGNHEITEVRTNECEGDHCKIHRGQQLKVEVDFVANQDTKTVRLDVIADAMGIKVPIGVDHDGCHLLPCPLKKGEKYTIKYNFDVSKAIPKVKATLTAKLQGEHGSLGCGKIKGEIA